MPLRQCACVDSKISAPSIAPQVIGLDITHRCHMTGAELDGLREAGAHGKFVHQISQFYLQYHQASGFG